MKQLSTASEVVEALGGTGVVARATGRSAPAVSYWRKLNVFPADTYLWMSRRLSEQDAMAPVALWAWCDPSKSRRRSRRRPRLADVAARREGAAA